MFKNGTKFKSAIERDFKCHSNRKTYAKKVDSTDEKILEISGGKWTLETLTPEEQDEFRDSDAFSDALAAWDCDSILVLKADRIVEI